jgi:zinc transport system substrate-binding protein
MRRPPVSIVILLWCVCTFLTTSCQRTPQEAPEPAGRSGQLQVVATVLPVENLTLAITMGATNLEVQGLLPSTGGCPHDYSLTPGDLKKLGRADALIAVGLDYEPFLDKVQENFGGRIQIVLAGDKVDKLIDTGDTDEHHHEHGAFNGHPFVSPKQAAAMARAIATHLVQMDPAEADLLRRNTENLVAELEAIHADMAAFVGTIDNKRVVAVSPIFGYLLRDIGLEQVAVLVLHHLDTLSAGRMAEVTRQLKEAPPALILNEDQFDERIARSLGEAVRVKVITVGTQTSGPRGPTAFVAQARAIMSVLKGGLGGKP